MPDSPDRPGGQVESEPDQHLTVMANDLSVQFIDLIKAEATPEIVCLNLYQGLPQGMQPDARLVTRVALSWPHLMRTRDLIDRLIEHNKERVVESINSLR